MPATAGRVRMPANNRVHSSAALQTHGIWQSAIGYDPYAPNKDDDKNSSVPNSTNSEPDTENAYASFQGLLALARITGSNADEARGSCKKCGRVGHLSFQCRNFLSLKDEEKDPAAIEADVLSELDKLKGNVGKLNGKRVVESSDESSEEEEDDESRDSDYNSEIERIIAERNGKRFVRNGRSLKKKKVSRDDDDSDTDNAKGKKRGRSKKRRSLKRKSDESDSSGSGRKNSSRKEKRRKRDESSDEEVEHRSRRQRKSMKEKRRRRSHRYSDDSESEDSDRHHRKRKSRRATKLSDSDASDSDDSRVGRGKKRSEKNSRKRHQ